MNTYTLLHALKSNLYIKGNPNHIKLIYAVILENFIRIISPADNN